MLTKLKNYLQQQWTVICCAFLILLSALCWNNLLGHEMHSSSNTLAIHEVNIGKSTSRNLKKDIGVFASFVLVVTNYWPDQSQD